MVAFGRLFVFLLVICCSVALSGQNSSPDFTSLNGIWQIVAPSPDPSAPDTVRTLRVVLRVDGNKIYGVMDVSRLCRRPDGGPAGWGEGGIRFQSDIAPDGSFAIRNKRPWPAYTILVRGVVPTGDDWSGSFSISAFDDHEGHQCPAASGNFDAMRSQQDNGVYSGVLKVAGTEEKAEVTLELSPGGLTTWKGARPPFDRTIGIDARVTVSATMFFKGGTFSTSPHPQGMVSQLEASGFTAYFLDGDFPDPDADHLPDAVHLRAEVFFNPWHEDKMTITLTHESTYEARWDASGELTRK